LKAELIYNVLFILYSSVCGIFPLGFEKLPFRPKFPLHVNPFRAVTRSQASAARKASPFLGPCPHRDRDYVIGSNFWKFYLLEEPVSHLVKVFRLFRLERIVLVFTVWTQWVDVQYWQGQRVCDALFFKLKNLVPRWPNETPVR
jgi:hypothetical protein